MGTRWTAPVVLLLVAVVSQGCRSSSTSGNESGGAGTPGPCLSSGTDATLNAALSGAGTSIELCPGAVFALSHTVRFSAPGQTLRTWGSPVDDRRALLRI